MPTKQNSNVYRKRIRTQKRFARRADEDTGDSSSTTMDNCPEWVIPVLASISGLCAILLISCFVLGYYTHKFKKGSINSV